MEAVNMALAIYSLDQLDPNTHYEVYYTTPKMMTWAKVTYNQLVAIWKSGAKIQKGYRLNEKGDRVQMLVFHLPDPSTTLTSQTKKSEESASISLNWIWIGILLLTVWLLFRRVK